MLEVILLTCLIVGFFAFVARILSRQIRAADCPVRDPWSPEHREQVRKARQAEEEIKAGPSWASFPRGF